MIKLKSKEAIILTIIIIVFILLIQFSFMSVHYPKYKSINETEINELAFQISESHDYKFGIYDCTQYAKDLKVELRKRGYNAFCVFGWLRFDGRKERHNWVMIKDGRKEIFIEATQGNDIGIIPKEIYHKNYIETTRGICN